MKNIFNPYLSNDEKDVLWEIQRLEELNATVSAYAKLFELSTNATAVCGQINAVAESVSANGEYSTDAKCTATASKPRIVVGIW